MIIIQSNSFTSGFDELALNRCVFVQNERISSKKALLCPMRRDINNES